MAHDVFVSHASQDKSLADAVCAGLEQNGIRCWVAPRDIQPGADWGESIVEGIRKSRVLVLVFTSHANASPHIRREVEQAVKHGIAVIPLRVEDVIPEGSLEYNLSTVHWLDAITPPLEAHIRHLGDTVMVLLQAGAKAVGAQDSVRAAPPSSRAPAASTPSPQSRVLRWFVPLASLAGIVVVIVVASRFWPSKEAPSPQHEAVAKRIASVPPPGDSKPTEPAVLPSPENGRASEPSSKPVKPKMEISLKASKPHTTIIPATGVGTSSESIRTEPEPAPPRSNPSPPPTREGAAIAGCWVGQGGTLLTIRPNGTFVSADQTGRWEIADSGSRRYALYWPEVEYNLVLLSDGRELRIAGYWAAGIATRDSAGTNIVGSWRLPSNVAISFLPDGTYTNGATVGTWRLTNAERHSYVLTLPALVLATTLTADNQWLSGTDQYGNPYKTTRTQGCADN